MLPRAAPLTLASLSLALAVATAHGAEIRPLLELSVRDGDDPAWAAPDLAASAGWEPASDLPRPGRLQWIRGTLDLAPEDVREPVGLRLTMQGAWELFFDGRPLGGSGSVGRSAETERAGPIDRTLLLPSDLARPGSHVVAIRCSTFTSAARGPNLWMVLGPYAELVLLPRRNLVLGAVHLGALLLIAAWAGIAWLGERRDRSNFWLAAFAAATLVFAANIVWRRSPGYSWEWQSLRIALYVGATFVRGLSLTSFVATRFSLGRLGSASRIAFLLATPVLYFSSERWEDYLGASELLALASLALVVGIAIQRRHWSLVSLALPVAYFCYLILHSPWDYLTSGLFWGTDLLFAVLWVTQALDHRRNRDLRRQLLQRLRRLELEMQRRQLQPHFLMNTLTTLSERLVESGEEAEAIIVALAEEIHLLGGLTREPLVRLADEVRLCRAHLEVMSLDRGRRFALLASSIDRDQAIPPAVLHTLAENALTHNRYRQSEVTLRLEQTAKGRGVELRFSAPLAAKGKPGSRQQPGLGRQYIEARLEEAFPGAWHFEERACDGYWLSRIEIPRRSLPPPATAGSEGSRGREAQTGLAPAIEG